MHQIKIKSVSAETETDCKDGDVESFAHSSTGH